MALARHVICDRCVVLASSNSDTASSICLLQDQSAHLRATKSLQTLGQHNMDPASAFFPLEEGGQLLLTLLPLPYQLPKLVEGAAADQEAMEALRQV